MLAGMASPLSFGGSVADLTRVELKRLASLGAKARLEELREEEAAIRKAFPDLFSGRSASTAAASGKKGKKRGGNMSAAARKAVSLRMKKYWAARRSAAAKAKGK
jgi:hypothetical protein